EEKRRIKKPPSQLTLAVPGVKKHNVPPPWFALNVKSIYPLIDLGMKREDCQQYNAAFAMAVPPSNCKFCHHKTDEEILWTSMKYPDDFETWATLEQEKIEHWKTRTPAGKNNSGVRSQESLREVATRMYATLRPKFPSDMDLLDYLENFRFTRGHCVSTSY
ncbi:MAG: hypothetical protein ACYDA1_04370, partial [Vulcanimicrobiaceae bacterium]